MIFLPFLWENDLSFRSVIRSLTIFWCFLTLQSFPPIGLLSCVFIGVLLVYFHVQYQVCNGLAFRNGDQQFRYNFRGPNFVGGPNNILLWHWTLSPLGIRNGGFHKP